MGRTTARPPPDQSEPEAETESISLDPSVQNVNTLAQLHARSEHEVDHHQRRIETLTAALGRPRILYSMLLGVLFWVTYNLVAPAVRLPRFDPPPFFWLQGTVGLLALLMTTVVLITQNRQGKMAARRALLDLHVNLLSEQKAAKLIALLEELRRDLPSVGNRHDPQAEVMSRPVDPQSIIDKIEQRMEQVITERDHYVDPAAKTAGLVASVDEVAREAEEVAATDAETETEQ